MTNLPPPDPRSSQRTPLGFDEFIGIFVAFATIGAILFLLLGKNRQGLDLTSLLSSSPAPVLTPTIAPSALSPVPVPPVSATAPIQSPEVLTPAPYRSRILPALIPLPAPAAPTPTPSASLQAVNFVDVPQDYWARPFIDSLSERGIVTGFPGGYFRPDEHVSRAEFAAMVQKAFEDKKPVRSAGNFKDVPPKYWASPAIDEAYKTGFLNGYPKDVFVPAQQIPRVQAFVALVTGLGFTPPANSAQILSIYKDADQIPNYAKDKMAAATQAGLVVNHPDINLLKPAQEATRAEVAALIYQALAKTGKVDKLDSAYVVKP